MKAHPAIRRLHTAGTAAGSRQWQPAALSLNLFREIDTTSLETQGCLPAIVDRAPWFFLPYGREVFVRFNCCLAATQGHRWLLYRVEYRPWWCYSSIRAVQLDQRDRVMPASDRHLDIPTAYGDTGAEDPRPFLFRRQLYVSWTDGHRMGISALSGDMVVGKSVAFATLRPGKREKNWIFFESAGSLFAKTWTEPHDIWKVDLKRGVLHGRMRTRWASHWEWGEIHGGTTPILHGGLFWSFFHSHFPGVASPGRKLANRYFIGVYAFEAKPPFRVRWCARYPLIAPWNDPINFSLRPTDHAVLFPTSAERSDDGWKLWLGVNDLRCGSIFASDRIMSRLMARVG